MKVSLENNIVRLTAENDREMSFIHAQSLLINDSNFTYIRQWLFTAKEAVEFLESIAREDFPVTLKHEQQTDSDFRVFSCLDYEICCKVETKESIHVIEQFEWILAPDKRFGHFFLWQFEDALDASFDNALDLVIYRRNKSLYHELLEKFENAR